MPNPERVEGFFQNTIDNLVRPNPEHRARPNICNVELPCFPTDCQVCHTTTNWLGAVFDHNKTTFPLTGAHTTVACATCHVNNNYTTLPTDCYGCHTKDFNGTTNPNHAKSGFPTTCAVCHNTTTWLNATFDHNKTAFPLTGAHTTVACATCHVNNNFTTLPTDCYGCHQKDFKPVGIQAISEEGVRDEQLAWGASEAEVEAHLSIYCAIRHGVLSHVADGVDRVLGRRPITFTQWVNENV